MPPTQVLVTGAGPTGLTLACGLAAQGIAVTVVDAAPGPATTSRANILHARGVEVLTRVGALGDLPARSLAPVGMTMHARGKALTTMRFAPDTRESTQALFISQAAVEAELRRRLDELGVPIQWNRRVLAATPDTDGVTVDFGDNAPIRTDWLVGCDGARSTVRGLSGIDFPGVPVVEQFLLADVRADWDRDRSTSAGWFHTDGMLLAIPMRDNDGGLWRLMADVPKTSEHLEPEQIIARFERLLPERTGETGVRIREALWTSVFRIQRRLADSYRAGRVLLAGDAAHIHSPIGGQGMNTGIGDAENLAWKLALVAHGRADESLLDTYTAERRPLATEVLRRTTANTRVLVGDGPVSRALRDWLFVPLLNLPAVQRDPNRVPAVGHLPRRPTRRPGQNPATGRPDPGPRLRNRRRHPHPPLPAPELRVGRAVPQRFPHGGHGRGHRPPTPRRGCHGASRPDERRRHPRDPPRRPPRLARRRPGQAGTVAH
ncbi:monooxygenase FAD-binding protein [Stackebrandtia nassauensis DSM 44728]|uniref:Monooxygenase FAD-binding protein n=1 Tax=Stackebrandtia nassauensis (strain DSM 44728 / CIP 108903 / NRRL B-16338 / NBRC 102104 / LLR-40K-21) TaxID=446470 RepID=D3Q178_STANL|nr:FAD-dependent monooxygenase [Stackebrandtia nassauensis]ADD45658.1 monooxygenase FAD-binding protein [Stackebrandtia nassauensis DSM 44728]